MKDFERIEYEVRDITFDIDGERYNENIEVEWIENVWDEILICIEKYNENSKAINCKDLDLRKACNITIENIVSYARQWDSATIKILAMGDAIIQAFIYPNREIRSERELAIFEMSAGYGDEMFARYDDRIGEFVPCGKTIGKKVNRCLATISQ